MSDDIHLVMLDKTKNLSASILYSPILRTARHDQTKRNQKIVSRPPPMAEETISRLNG